MTKRIIACLGILSMALCLISFHYIKLNRPNDVYADIGRKLIRFHVIANSDSDEDQSLKLKVRDRILAELSPKIGNLETVDESRDFIKSNMEYIKNIATDEILKNGKNYDVALNLGNSWFPIKTYGDVALPAGNYDALKVVIGKGEGKNWWCVLFPPLCFIDISHGSTDAATEEKLRAVLGDEEYETILVNSSKNNKGSAVKKPLISESKVQEKADNKSEDKVEIKFKSVEIAKSIWNRLENIFDCKD